MADRDGNDGFVALGPSACWELLPRAQVGRLAWADPDGRIMVVPVNFGLDGQNVIVRTGHTALLDAARARRRCAFQAEDLEPGLRSGWTVLVDGTLTEVVDEAMAAQLGRLVDPWLHGPRPHVLQLVATGVSGRSLRTAGGIQIIAVEDI